MSDLAMIGEGYLIFCEKTEKWFGLSVSDVLLLLFNNPCKVEQVS